MRQDKFALITGVTRQTGLGLEIADQETIHRAGVDCPSGGFFRDGRPIGW